jgi:hypothetical protein
MSTNRVKSGEFTGVKSCEIKTFASRDDQEVAGYAGAMETIFLSDSRVKPPSQGGDVSAL